MIADPIAFGLKLRGERERRAMTVADFAIAHRMPPHAIRAIEAGSFDGLGASVYRNGFLRAYARALGIEALEVEPFLVSELPDEPAKGPSLIPREVSWFERHGAAFGYLVGTGVVIGSVLMWVFGAEPLAPNPGSMPVGSSTAPVPVTLPPNTQPAKVEDSKTRPAPIVASLAPLMVATEESTASSAAIDTAIAQASPASVSGEFVLRLAAQSWIEVTRINGERLAYDLYAPGTEHRFVVGDGLRVRIGNATAATAELNGSAFDLNAHTQGAVARFELPLARN